MTEGEVDSASDVMNIVKRIRVGGVLELAKILGSNVAACRALDGTLYMLFPKDVEYGTESENYARVVVTRNESTRQVSCDDGKDVFESLFISIKTAVESFGEDLTDLHVEYMDIREPPKGSMGMNALVKVRLRMDDRHGCYCGNHPDVVRAAAEAIIHAINNLLYVPQVGGNCGVF